MLSKLWLFFDNYHIEKKKNNMKVESIPIVT